MAAPPLAHSERRDVTEGAVSHSLREGENEAGDFRRCAGKQPERRVEATVAKVELSKLFRRELVEEGVGREHFVEREPQLLRILITKGVEADARRESARCRQRLLEVDPHREGRTPEPVAARGCSGREPALPRVVGDTHTRGGVHARGLFRPLEEHAPAVRSSHLELDIGLADPDVAVTGHLTVLVEHAQALAADLGIPKPGLDFRGVDRPLARERTPVEL